MSYLYRERLLKDGIRLVWEHRLLVFEELVAVVFIKLVKLTLYTKLQSTVNAIGCI